MTTQEFWEKFENGATIENDTENPTPWVYEGKYNKGVLPELNERNFCGQCVGCAAHGAMPTKPIFKIFENSVLSDGGTCFKPTLYKVKRGMNINGRKTYEWVATHFLGKGGLIKK